MALAHLMAKQHTNASFDEDSLHLLNQFTRREGTPRRDYRSSTPNEQVRALPTASATAAATQRDSIHLLAESSSAWNFVQQAAATGTATDVLWEPIPDEVAATVQEVVDVLQRTSAERAQP